METGLSSRRANLGSHSQRLPVGEACFHYDGEKPKSVQDVKLAAAREDRCDT
jgi:hypothetical protein